MCDVPTILWAYSDVLGFHTRNVWSVDALTTHLPSVVNPPQVMGPSWPANTAKTSPFTPFHIQMVASSPPHNNALPLGCHSRNYVYHDYFKLWVLIVVHLSSWATIRGCTPLSLHSRELSPDTYHHRSTPPRTQSPRNHLKFWSPLQPHRTQWRIHHKNLNDMEVIYLHDTYWLGFTGLRIT